MQQTIKHQAIIPEKSAGLRLDQALATLFPQYSRMKLKNWIENKKITLNQNSNWRPRDKVSGGEQISINAELEVQTQSEPEPIKLDIVYEDHDLIIVNKPVGMVVHPGTGNASGTLLNALLYHCPQLQEIPRAGIIHRLDKDTSGLLVIAKTIVAHTKLVRQLQKRKIQREYEAIVRGVLTGGGTIEQPIGRHPKKRIRMAVTEKGKSAVTHYRIIERFHGYTHIQVQLETGRTHQIRVHMAYIHHPIVGDPTYSGRKQLPKNASPKLIEALKVFNHQALHAKKLGLKHPTSKEWMSWEVDVPKDFKTLLALLTEK